MNTLTYGQKIPEQGDRGDELFDALEGNFTRLDGHKHDGIDSPLLTGAAFVGVPDSILSANWVAFGPVGHYRQLVTLPGGFLFNTVTISFRTSDGKYVNPTVERFSNTQYYIYSIDNTLDLTAVYGG